MAISFTKSYLGLIFNPVGYSAQRKGNSEAANEYGMQNPPSEMLLQSRVGYTQSRIQWCNACAAKLKSDDVGKSKANALAACQEFFDTDAAVQEVRAQVDAAGEQERLQLADENRALIEKLIGVAIAIVLLVVLVKLFKD